MIEWVKIGIDVLAIIAAAYIAIKFGEHGVYEKQRKEAAKAHLQRQMAVLEILLSDVARMREVAAHNAEKRGDILPFRTQPWESALLSETLVLPRDSRLLDAARTLLIQVEYVNFQIALFYKDRTTYGYARESVWSQCSGQVGPGSPYDIPSTLNLVEGHLQRVKKQLESGRLS